MDFHDMKMKLRREKMKFIHRMHAHTHTLPRMDSIASVSVIMTPQEVKRNSGCPAVEYTVEEYERRMFELS